MRYVVGLCLCFGLLTTLPNHVFPNYISDDNSSLLSGIAANLMQNDAFRSICSQYLSNNATPVPMTDRCQTLPPSRSVVTPRFHDVDKRNDLNPVSIAPVSARSRSSSSCGSVPASSGAWQRTFDSDVHTLPKWSSVGGDYANKYHDRQGQEHVDDNSSLVGNDDNNTVFDSVVVDTDVESKRYSSGLRRKCSASFKNAKIFQNTNITRRDVSDYSPPSPKRSDEDSFVQSFDESSFSYSPSSGNSDDDSFSCHDDLSIRYDDERHSLSLSPKKALFSNECLHKPCSSIHDGHIHPTFLDNSSLHSADVQPMNNFQLSITSSDIFELISTVARGDDCMYGNSRNADDVSCNISAMPRILKLYFDSKSLATKSSEYRFLSICLYFIMQLIFWHIQ